MALPLAFIVRGLALDVLGQGNSNSPTKPELKVTFEDKGLNRKIRQAINVVDDLRFEFGEITRSLSKYNQEQFNLKGNGQYEPLSEAYNKWKKKNYPGKSILRLEDQLYDSLTSNQRAGFTAPHPDTVLKITKKGMEYGTKTPHAIYVQEGTKNMPARPIYFLDFGRKRIIQSILESGVKRRMQAI